MRLPEWCQTHSLKDFMELVELGNKNKGKIMENDNLPTAELVSSEVSGYLGPNGEFIPGEPPAQEPRVHPVYVQTDEDVSGE